MRNRKTGAIRCAAVAGNPEQRIEVWACPFGGRFGTTIYPRRVDRPSVEFRSHAEARGYAETLAKIERLPVIDRTGESDR